MRRLALCAVGLTACQPQSPPPGADRAHVRLSPAQSVFGAGMQDTTLPTALGNPLVEGTPIVVSRSGVRFGDRIVASIKRGEIEEEAVKGHLVTALYDALVEEVDRARTEAAELGVAWHARAVLAADADTTFVSLVDVMYTAGRAEYRRYAWVVTPGDGEGPAQIPISAPKFRGPEVPEEPPDPELSIALVHGGYSIGHGAATRGAPVAVRSDGFESITRHATQLRERSPHARRVVVSAEADVPLRRVAAAVAAARGPGCQLDGTHCVLPDVTVTAGDPHPHRF